MSWIDDLNSQQDIGNVYRFQPVANRQTQQQKKKKGGRGGTLTSLISEGGALGGAATGAAIGSAVPVIGTVIGGVIGGAGGALAGRLAENKIRDDRWGVGDAAKEAALTGVLGAPGKTLKYGITAARGFKGAREAVTLADALKTAELTGKSSTKSIPIKFIPSETSGIGVQQTTRSTLTNPKVSELEDAISGMQRGGYNVSQKMGATRGSSLPEGVGVAPDFTPLKPSSPVSTVQLTGKRNTIRFGDNSSGLAETIQGTGRPQAREMAIQRGKQVAGIDNSASQKTSAIERLGDTLATALTAGAKAADAPGLVSRALGRAKGKVADVATNVRDDAALKNFKLNDSNWISKFQQKVGEDPGAFAARLGFATSNPKDVAERFYNPLQDAYTSYLQQVPAITKKDVQEALSKRVAEYAKSDVADVRAMGEKLKSESDTLLSRLPDNLSALDARSKKAAFQSAVDEKLTDSAGKLANNTNKQIADVFRSLINDKADAAGIVIDPAKLPFSGSKATSIRELGNELRGIKEFADKAAIKQNVGRGKNPLGITSTIGATGGGAMAGVPGAAIGAGITAAANSQTGRRAEFNIAQRLANMSKSTAGPIRRGLGVGARGVASVSLVDALNQSPLEPVINDSTQMSMNTAATPNSSNMTDTSYQNDNNMSSSNSAFDPSTIEQNVAKMAASGASIKDIEGYLSIAGAMQDMQLAQAKAGKGAGLNSTQLQQANNAQSGLDSLNTIGSILSQDPNAAKKAALPGGSFTESLTGTGSYQAALNNATDVIGRLRSGGAINADEEKRFRKLLPGAFDSPQTVQYKLGTLSQLFQRFSNPQAAQPDLAGALGL